MIIIFGLVTISFMIFFVYQIYKISRVELNKNEKWLLFISIIGLAIVFSYVIITRRNIYIWDYSYYYNKQIDFLEIYQNNGFFSFLKAFIRTTYYDDYGGFLLLFTTPLFYYSNWSGIAFQLSTFITIVVPSIILLYITFKKVIEKINLSNTIFIKITTVLFLVTFGRIYKSLFEGQPDIIGLIYCCSIMLLTLDYNFRKIEKKRWIYLIISVFFLIISRRWYAFWLVGYVLSYGLSVIIDVIKNTENRKEQIRNIILFSLITGISIFALLFPMITRILGDNYKVSYSAWNLGGIRFELKNQFEKTGLLYVILYLIGVIYGVYNKDTRRISLIVLGQQIITFLLFTSVQNMGDHQSLIIIVPLAMFIICGIIIISKVINNSYLKYIFVTFVVCSSFYGSLTENKLFYSNVLYSNISLKPIIRTDYWKIKEMVDLFSEISKNENEIYINAASTQYCANTFQHFYLPDRSLKNHIIYESSIDSVHGFPIGILDAKYIVVSNVNIENTGAKTGHIIAYINESIKSSDISNRFKKIKSFNMGNGVTFYLYERIKEADEEEINYYIKKFKDVSLQYPELYEKRLIEYEKSIISNTNVL